MLKHTFGSSRRSLNGPEANLYSYNIAVNTKVHSFLMITCCYKHFHALKVAFEELFFSLTHFCKLQIGFRLAL